MAVDMTDVFTDTASLDAPYQAVDEWVDIVAQHAVRTPTRVFSTFITKCGRTAMGTPHRFDMTKKSCESCLRLLEKERER